MAWRNIRESNDMEIVEMIAKNEIIVRTTIQEIFLAANKQSRNREEYHDYLERENFWKIQDYPDKVQQNALAKLISSIRKSTLP